MILTVTVNAPDDLEAGQCDRCPFGYVEYTWDEDDGGDWLELCSLEVNGQKCPLEK